VKIARTRLPGVHIARAAALELSSRTPFAAADVAGDPDLDAVAAAAAASVAGVASCFACVVLLVAAAAAAAEKPLA